MNPLSDQSGFAVGDRVTHPDDPENAGTVERIEDRWTVWVRFPIPGHPGKSDLIDLDPSELTRLALDEKE